ncbi:hypothetical protein ABEW12_19185 [Bacillus licheniformis]
MSNFFYFLLCIFISPFMFFGVDKLLMKIGFEKYKNNLRKDIEGHKNRLLLDLQRKTHDFQLFTEKKHKKYAELHSTLFEATDLVLEATDLFSISCQYKNLNNKDLKNIIESHDLGDTEKEKLYDLLDNNKKEDLDKELNEMIRQQKFKKAEDLSLQGYILFRESLIYLSDDVAKVCNEILNKQKKLLVDFYNYRNGLPGIDVDKLKGDTENLKKSMEKLGKSMRKELSIGYYEDEEGK